MASRFKRVVVTFFAALALLLLLLVAFGSATGEVELVIFVLLSAAFGWFVGRPSKSTSQ